MTTIKRLGVAGDQWLCEVKLDGYGALLLRNGGHVQIRSRKSNDLTATYPHVVAAALALNAQSAVLDGEIVALDKQGRPSFQAIQHRASERTPPSTTASTSCTSTARI